MVSLRASATVERPFDQALATRVCGHLGERSEDVIEPRRCGRDCEPNFGNLERVLDESLFALENGEFVVSGGDCAPSVIE
jgi:hypothetical protein